MKTIEPWQITVEGPGWLAGVSGQTYLYRLEQEA